MTGLDTPTKIASVANAIRTLSLSTVLALWGCGGGGGGGGGSGSGSSVISGVASDGLLFNAVVTAFCGDETGAQLGSAVTGDSNAGSDAGAFKITRNGTACSSPIKLVVTPQAGTTMEDVTKFVNGQPDRISIPANAFTLSAYVADGSSGNIVKHVTPLTDAAVGVAKKAAGGAIPSSSDVQSAETAIILTLAGGDADTYNAKPTRLLAGGKSLAQDKQTTLLSAFANIAAQGSSGLNSSKVSSALSKLNELMQGDVTRNANQLVVDAGARSLIAAFSSSIARVRVNPQLAPAASDLLKALSTANNALLQGTSFKIVSGRIACGFGDCASFGRDGYSGGGGGGGGGGSAGAGAGGGMSLMRNVKITAYTPSGTVLGSAPLKDGLVSIFADPNVGPLILKAEDDGSQKGEYYDEAKKAFVSIGNSTLHALIPSITGDMSINALTEAAYRRGRTLFGAESNFTATNMKQVNELARAAINGVLPPEQQLPDITILPTLITDTTPLKSLSTDEPGKFATVLAAFAIQANTFKSTLAAPALAFVNQVAQEIGTTGSITGTTAGAQKAYGTTLKADLVPAINTAKSTFVAPPPPPPVGVTGFSGTFSSVALFSYPSHQPAGTDSGSFSGTRDADGKVLSVTVTSPRLGSLSCTPGSSATPDCGGCVGVGTSCLATTGVSGQFIVVSTPGFFSGSTIGSHFQCFTGAGTDHTLEFINSTLAFTEGEAGVGPVCTFN